MISVCLDVNHGGTITNRNRCIQRIVILIAAHQLPGHADLLFWVLSHHIKYLIAVLLCATYTDIRSPNLHRIDIRVD